MEPLVGCLKGIPVNKILSKFLCLLLSACLSAGAPLGAYAQTTPNANLCRAIGVAFVFFNGVNTTPAGATAALEEFRKIHGTTSPAGDPIRYEKLYNYSNGFEDFVETFEQRLLEQEGLLGGRFELFFEALNGNGSWWSRIIDVVASADGILTGFVDWYKAAVINELTSLFGNPPTSLNYLEHRARIDNLILEGNKLLFVAHSQGNLFVNAAYNYALTKTSAVSVKVVHIAPASPTLNGSHILADLDLVINGLRVVGTVASITDSIPGYLLRPAGANGKKDPLGHGLIEIYINPALSLSTRVYDYIQNGFNALVAPPTTAAPGFFTATLTWDGSGDVDLHAYEPGGSHVYYGAKHGTTGYLDVDNTSANGPEHYYASCDATNLQTGTYTVSVANFSGSDGRTATVQIASWSDGVLGTKFVTLGTATGSNPTYTMFNVVISKDALTGRYSISIP